MRSSILKATFVALAIGMSSSIMVTDTADAISLPRTMADGKVCRMLLGAAHMHSGKSFKASATKHSAFEAAVIRWSRFTAWEYGPEWGDFRIAARQTASCAPARRGGWKCKVEAQPCRY